MHVRIAAFAVPVALLAAASFGCVPAVDISTYEPAQYNLGRATTRSTATGGSIHSAAW